MEDVYLINVKKQFEYYKKLGEKTMTQLSEEELFWQYNEECNSVAIIVKHLWGNMMSRWTDFLQSDGEKEWRNRDAEFETQSITSRKEMLAKWQEGWATLFTALDTITPANFDTEIYIRNQRHSITEAINRQMMHYAYHIGQIVYIGKMLRASDWQSLSIPRGNSEAHNRDKFSKGKHGGHFADEI